MIDYGSKSNRSFQRGIDSSIKVIDPLCKTGVFDFMQRLEDPSGIDYGSIVQTKKAYNFIIQY